MSDSHRIEVLMLGWEYPPHISGGLGTACEGLTTALAPLDVAIDFVVPHVYGQERAPHMHLTSPELSLSALDPLAFPRNYGGDGDGARESPEAPSTSFTPRGASPLAVALAADDPYAEETLDPSEGTGVRESVRIRALLSPYLSAGDYDRVQRALASGDRTEIEALFGPQPTLWEEGFATSRAPAGREGPHYGDDLFGEVLRYAEQVAHWSRGRRMQVVHAHDWMTFPAATRVAEMHGIPMVAHVHSLEQDRSGNGGNPTIIGIEGAGVRAATRVIAVSHYTARMIHQLHGVPFERIDVVHNGAYPRKTVSAYRAEAGHDGRATVLFLGRITYQKGPDYFVEAASKVLQELPETRFVMAGNGDMLPRLQHRVHELGIAHAFDFPGFVRGADVERMFSTADVYVMPSVSEPFGISALEAMSFETPVVLSRQSGASEILHHALKVDFWDVNRLASQIVAILRYPELRSSIVDMAREEVRRVHWEAAAAKVRKTYAKVLGGS